MRAVKGSLRHSLKGSGGESEGLRPGKWHVSACQWVGEKVVRSGNERGRYSPSGRVKLRSEAVLVRCTTLKPNPGCYSYGRARRRSIKSGNVEKWQEGDQRYNVMRH